MEMCPWGMQFPSVLIKCIADVELGVTIVLFPCQSGEHLVLLGYGVV